MSFLATPTSQLTERVIGWALRVRRALGPGLLESAYHACLARDLELEGIPFESGVDVPLLSRGPDVKPGFRIHLTVDKAVVIGLKSVANLLPVHEAQLLTYMELTRLSTGLLFNFNVPVLKDGIRRLLL